jgi:hypothetical protein
VLGQYDLVFAKGRCAWESLAVGTAVIVCDTWGVGPLVTTAQLPSLRSANFGRRLLQQPLRVDVLAREIARYDAADAADVSRQIRATASVDQMVDRLLECYAAAIAAHREAATDLAADMRAAAAFLRGRTAPGPSFPSASNGDSLQTNVERLRSIIRDELKRDRRTTGLRKWVRSIRKHLPLPGLFRRAA